MKLRDKGLLVDEMEKPPKVGWMTQVKFARDEVWDWLKVV